MSFHAMMNIPRLENKSRIASAESPVSGGWFAEMAEEKAAQLLMA
jgi:hypothetical protein